MSVVPSMAASASPLDGADVLKLDEWIWKEVASTIPARTRYGHDVDGRDALAVGTSSRKDPAAQRRNAQLRGSHGETRVSGEERRRSIKLSPSELAMSVNRAERNSANAGIEQPSADCMPPNSRTMPRGAQTALSDAEPRAETSANTSDAQEKRISFSRTMDEEGPRGHSRKVTLAQVKQAVSEQKQLATETQEARVAHQLEKAIKRAAGCKVKDDPRLLKRALKRQQKERVKRARAWQARLQAQSAAKEARQRERAASLKARRAARQQKRMLSRAKRLAKAS